MKKIEGDGMGTVMGAEPGLSYAALCVAGS